jgi:hypothetical protein
VKPFLLKCHPDVHVSGDAKAINLAAIQNLNSYLDTLQAIESADKFVRTRQSQERIFEIDFVLLMEAKPRMKKRDKVAGQNRTRRKVELVLPPFALCQEMADIANYVTVSHQTRKSPDYVRQRFRDHCRGELLKLMSVAGLDAPPDASMEDTNESDANWESVLEYGSNDPGGTKNEGVTSQRGSRTFQRSHHHVHWNATRWQKSRSPRQSAYEQSRQRFTANIQWHNYDKLYAQAVAEMNADAATEGLIEKSPGRRREMIASILAKVRLWSPPSPTLVPTAASHETPDEPEDSRRPEISFVEQLVAFRRLSLLLDQNFASLQMEEFGAMWETCRIVLTPSRPYNVSSSALHRRQRRQTESSLNDSTVPGFSFTLHPDWTVTIHIPIDFRDDELVQELDRNVWDFYNLLGDGTEDLFPDQRERSLRS